MANNILILNNTPAPNVLFQDDFSDDVGWIAPLASTPDTVNKPSKWKSCRRLSVADYRIVDLDGDAVLRVTMDAGLGYAELGSLQAEFEETTTAHIRFNVKLSEGYEIGSTSPLSTLFWKWWRLEQSEWVRGIDTPTGVSGQANSNFIIGSIEGPFLRHTAAWRDNGDISTDVPQVAYKHSSEPNDIPFGDKETGANSWRKFTNTKWVQVDVTYTLRDRNRDNGHIDVWYDGVRQVPFTTVLPFNGGQSPVVAQGCVTNPLSHRDYPAGFNSLTFIDNQANIGIDWTQQHYLYVKDIIIYDRKPHDI